MSSICYLYWNFTWTITYRIRLATTKNTELCCHVYVSDSWLWKKNYSTCTILWGTSRHVSVFRLSQKHLILYSFNICISPFTLTHLIIQLFLFLFFKLYIDNIRFVTHNGGKIKCLKYTIKMVAEQAHHRTDNKTFAIAQYFSAINMTTDVVFAVSRLIEDSKHCECSFWTKNFLQKKKLSKKYYKLENNEWTKHLRLASLPSEKESYSANVVYLLHSILLWDENSLVWRSKLHLMADFCRLAII